MKSFAAIVSVSLVIAAVGVVAIVAGEADDAPGLVVIGILLVVVAMAFGVRTARRTTRP
jgi:hypothetical protein